ncbi:MAG TPA: hypothetical protein VIL65_12145 [Beijerinckiaceae bacterium]|jgi:hypothetical protein
MLRFLVAVLIGATAACSLLPRPVEGLGGEAGWSALPLRSWLSEERGVPEAVALCAAPDCPGRLAVGVIRLSPDEARGAAAILADPSRLARELEARARAPSRKGAKPRPPTSIEVRPLGMSDRRGFAITLARRDGTQAVHGAVIATGADEVVIAIGDVSAEVEDAARRAARGRGTR